MGEFKVAVIGVGHLGKFHAQKYASLPDCELVAVVDIDAGAAARAARENDCRAYTDYREVLGHVDAVSIVVPARWHFSIARDALLAGAHVLVEKPIATRVEDAEELVRLAETRERVLQVGHLERFNPALLALSGRLKHPLFIESYRIAPYNPRGTDVNVVLDLMIHDIDLILQLVGSPVERVDASGAAVLTNDADIANARIRFQGGCVANVTASRVGTKSETKLRIFQPDAYLSVDLGTKRLRVRRKSDAPSNTGPPSIDSEDLSFEPGDALLTEISHFLDCIASGQTPLVSGIVGQRALKTAIEISRHFKQFGNA